MKKFLIAVMFGLMAIAAQAEATFNQVQTLIQQHQYQAAASGLETIIQNHPKSAKAFYAMAQAQAGLGNLEKAQKALDIATGLNPTLDFAPASSVASLKEAITPQVKKIETIEESHFWRNTIMALILASAIGFVFMMYIRKEQEAEARAQAERDAELDRIRTERDAQRKREHMEMLAQQEAERKAEEALKSHPNYNHERFDPATPDKLKTVKQFKAEQAEAARVMAEQEAQYQRQRAERAEMDARLARSNASSGPAHTTVVNNSSNDMLTGVLIGNMLSGPHHHDTTRVVEREVVREVPAPSRSSSWDDTPSKPSRSSSWDDDSSSSSSKSSSWDSSSSSSSSSSWDSGSSSSDSGSSSSWD